MRVLITGGAGYIGSHTAAKFKKEKAQVTIVDNLSTGSLKAIPNYTSLFVAHIQDTQQLTEIMTEKKIDIVIHFAAKIVVSDSVKEPLYYYENNVGGLISVLEACRMAGVTKFGFSSTAAVYGNPKNIPISETDELNPINPYGQSKLMCEKIIQDYAASSQLNYVILRYFNVAGASKDNGQRSANATHLIKIACEVAAGKRKSIQIFGTDYPTTDGTCIRDYVHVEDLADAHYLAAEYLQQIAHNLILNCGSERGFSVREVIYEIEKITQKKLSIEISEKRPGDPPRLIANSSLIRSLLNWQPKKNDLNLIIRSALRWENAL